MIPCPDPAFNAFAVHAFNDSQRALEDEILDEGLISLQVEIPLDEMMREHGVTGWKSAPALTASGELGPPAIPPSVGAVSGGAPVDAGVVADLAVPGPTSGRSSLLEVHAESSRIQRMIQAHRQRVAERERLEDLAHTREWMS